MAIISLNVPAVSASPIPAFSMNMDVQSDRLLIGQGFNSITGESGGMAVVFNENDLVTAGGGRGQITRVEFMAIESAEQLKEKLNISAAASLGFGIFNGDVAAQFFRNALYTRHNTFLYVDVIVVNPAEVLKKAILTRAALQRLEDGQAAFLDYCGNSYVYGRQTGGRLTAVVQFSSTDMANFTETNVRVNAQVKAVGNGSVKIDQAIESLKGISDTNICMLRRGGVEAMPSVSELAKAVLDFPARVAQGTGNPVVVNMLTRGYNTVDNLPSNKLNFAILDQQAKTLDHIASLLLRAYGNQGDLSFVKAHPNLFVYAGDLNAAVDEAFSKNAEIIRFLLDKAIEVRRNPMMDAPPPPDYPTVNLRRIDPPPPTTTLPLPPPPLPVLEMFENIGYGGRRLATSTSIGNLADRDFNDILSSFKVNGNPGEYLVEFFRHADYQDRLMQVQSPCEVPFLPEIPIGTPPFRRTVTLNDQVSSVIITKRL
ncbi:MAG: hypothetical protein ACM359_00580 [Bacillota bacterium]